WPNSRLAELYRRKGDWSIDPMRRSVVISIFGARLCAQHQSQHVSQALRLVFDTAAPHQIKTLPMRGSVLISTFELSRRSMTAETALAERRCSQVRSPPMRTRKQSRLLHRLSDGLSAGLCA